MASPACRLRPAQRPRRQKDLTSYDVGSLWDDWAAVHELGLDSTRRSRNTYGEAVIRRNIGILERMRGCVEEAQANFGHALGVFDRIGDGPRSPVVHELHVW